MENNKWVEQNFLIWSSTSPTQIFQMGFYGKFCPEKFKIQTLMGVFIFDWWVRYKLKLKIKTPKVCVQSFGHSLEWQIRTVKVQKNQKTRLPHHVLDKIANYAAEFVLIPFDAECVMADCEDVSDQMILRRTTDDCEVMSIQENQKRWLKIGPTKLTSSRLSIEAYFTKL